MKNLYMVQVVDAYGPNKFLPLASGYMWAYASKFEEISNNWELKHVLIEKQDVVEYVDEMDNPSCVSFSVYVWNWEYSKRVAEEVKRRYPDCLIVAGGPQLDYEDPEFFDKYPWFDVIVVGEGEPAFAEILRRHDTRDFDNIPHVLPKGGELCGPVLRINEVDEIPSPILNGFYDKIIDHYEAKYNTSFMWQVTYETMRGCPYSCQFCDIGSTYLTKTKFFDIERVYKEIDWISNRKIEYVSVCDSNWGIAARDKDITQYVIDKKLTNGYPKVWDVTWAKNNPDRIFDIAVLDKEANSRLFKGVTFAMQSFNASTLKAIKRFNLKEDVANTFMQKYIDENIPMYSELIWPMPNETYESLKAGIQKLVELGQKDFLMVHPLLVTNNAPMGKEEYKRTWGLKTKEVFLDTFYLQVPDKDTYIPEFVDTVIESNTASPQDVLEGYRFIHLFITMYYYGWGHSVMEYMFRKHGIKHIDFIDHMLKHFYGTDTLIGQELDITQKLIQDTFEKKTFWGRQVFGEDDIYWEYKSASSIVFHQNREQLKEEFSQYLKENYSVPDDLLRLNFDLCYDWREEYEKVMTYDPDVVNTVLGKPSSTVVLTHWDYGNLESDKEFVHVAYHYQRKNRYWRCDVDFK